MNAEKNTVSTQQRPPQKQSGEARTQQGTSQGGAMPPRMQSTRKKRPNPRLLARLRAAMLVVGSLILLLGLILVILPAFKLKTVEVKGNQYYSEMQIREIVNLTEGSELLSINLNETRDALLDKLEHVESVTVRSNLFKGSIEIEIVEKSDVAYLWHNGTYYSFDSQFYALDQSADPAPFSSFVLIELPEIAQITPGERIVFANAEQDMGYVFDLIEELKKAELLPYVTRLDCAQKYNNAVELNSNCRIEIGKVSKIPSKLELAQSILVSKGLAEGQCVVLDVSDLQKSTYRVMSLSDFLSAR